MHVKDRTVRDWYALAAGVGLTAGAYTTYVGVTWYHYGNAPRPVSPEEQDELIDRFMPPYEVVERHRVGVAAPASVTLDRERPGSAGR